MDQHNHPAQWSRALWAASEPFVLGLLFTPEGRDALVALGVPERGTYFVTRSAPMGRAEPAVVAAAFHGFPVAKIDAVLDGVWDTVSPAAVIDAHRASLSINARRIFGGSIDPVQLRHFADLLTGICAELDTAGRPLAAANQALAAPTETWARFWHASTILREYRGDAHIAALVSADLDVVESLALTVAWAGRRIDADMLQTSRQLSDADWAGGISRLVDRGLMTLNGRLTAAGTDLRERIESRTDQAALRPWKAMNAHECAALYQLLTALSARMVNTGAMRPVTPVGAPWPPPPLLSFGVDPA